MRRGFQIIQEFISFLITREPYEISWRIKERFSLAYQRIYYLLDVHRPLTQMAANGALQPRRYTERERSEAFRITACG